MQVSAPRCARFDIRARTHRATDIGAALLRSLEERLSPRLRVASEPHETAPVGVSGDGWARHPRLKKQSCRPMFRHVAGKCDAQPTLWPPGLLGCRTSDHPVIG